MCIYIDELVLDDNWIFWIYVICIYIDRVECVAYWVCWWWWELVIILSWPELCCSNLVFFKLLIWLSDMWPQLRLNCVIICWCCNLDRLAKDIVKALKKRLQHKNSHVHLLALTVSFLNAFNTVSFSNPLLTRICCAIGQQFLCCSLVSKSNTMVYKMSYKSIPRIIWYILGLLIKSETAEEIWGSTYM